MVPREGPDPPPTDAGRRIARRIAGAYFLFALACIVISDLALLDLTKNIPGLVRASLIKGGLFVAITAALLYLLVSTQLQRHPAPAVAGTAVRRLGRYSPVVLFAALAALAVALVIAMYFHASSEHRGLARNDLLAILELKADQIELFLSQRQATARAYSQARSLRDGLTRNAQHPDPKIVSNIKIRIMELQRDLELDAVLMLDAAGQLVAGSGPEELLQLSPEFAAQAVRSMASGERAAPFLHRDTQLPGGLVLLDYISPLPGTAGHPEVVGAIVLRENARGRFFRLLQEWPTTSATAEFLLVRRDGDDVLFLNDVRHATDTAFRLRRPLSETGLPAATAVTAKTAVLTDGTDYRGASVVASSRQIAETDWFLVTKMDLDEVLAPVRGSAWIWLGALLCMMLLAGFGVRVLWRQQMHLVATRERADAIERDALGKHLDLLSRNANDMILLVDSDARIVEANERAVERYEYPREVLIGMPAAQLRAPQESSLLDVRLAEILERKNASYASLHVTRTGCVFPVEVSGHVVEAVGGRYFQVIIRDVTKRKRAEEQLRKSEERYRALFERSLDCVFVADLEGNFLDANRAALDLLGYHREQISQISFRTLMSPDELQRAMTALNEAVRTGIQPETREYRLRRKDGSEVIVETKSAVVYDDAGPCAVQGNARDITERTKAETALRESEHRFRAMIEQSISGFYLIQDGKFAYVNSRFAEIFGYASPADVVGKSPSELAAEEDRATVAGNIQRRLSGEMKSMGYTYTGLCKDGTHIEVGVHGSFTIFQGRPAIIGLLQDISERKRGEDDARRYIARLEQAMQSTINVVATIGELRDPYTHGHERRVGEIAAAIATEMGLPDNQVEGIRVAGYLHDVGKIAVPAEILAKPTKLTEAEFNLVKDHAQQSYEILKMVPFPWPVAEAAWEHHERFDGSGYPRGLKGEEILPEARILAVADTIEAMASHRPYRPGLGIDKALAEIEQNRGKLYFPEVADACLRLFREKGYRLSA